MSADHQAQDSNSKSTAKEVLVIAWTGMEMFLKKVEGCFDGTVAKTPIAAIKCMLSVSVRYIFTDRLQAVGDNKGAIEVLIIQTAERLLAVDKAMDRGVPNSAKPGMKDFAT